MCGIAHEPQEYIYIHTGAEVRVDARTVNVDENEKANLAWGFRQSCTAQWLRFPSRAYTNSQRWNESEGTGGRYQAN